MRPTSGIDGGSIGPRATLGQTRRRASGLPATCRSRGDGPVRLGGEGGEADVLTAIGSGVRSLAWPGLRPGIRLPACSTASPRVARNNTAVGLRRSLAANSNPFGSVAAGAGRRSGSQAPAIRPHSEAPADRHMSPRIRAVPRETHSGLGWEAFPEVKAGVLRRSEGGATAGSAGCAADARSPGADSDGSPTRLGRRSAHVPRFVGRFRPGGVNSYAATPTRAHVAWNPARTR